MRKRGLSGARCIYHQRGHAFVGGAVGVFFAVFFVHVAATHHQHGGDFVFRRSAFGQAQITDGFLAVAPDFQYFLRRIAQGGGLVKAVEIFLIRVRFDRAHVGRADRRAGVIGRGKARQRIKRFRFEEIFARIGLVAARECCVGLRFEAFGDSAPCRHPVFVFGAFEGGYGVDQRLQVVHQIEPAAIKAADGNGKRVFVGAYRQRCQYRGLVLGCHGVKLLGNGTGTLRRVAANVKMLLPLHV